MTSDTFDQIVEAVMQRRQTSIRLEGEEIVSLSILDLEAVQAIASQFDIEPRAVNKYARRACGMDAANLPKLPRKPPVRRTHCEAGHEMTEENTYRRYGRRECSTCGRERCRQIMELSL